jgi:serralysin
MATFTDINAQQDMTGTEGDDLFVMNSVQTFEQVFGQGGNDTVSYANTGAVEVDLELAPGMYGFSSFYDMLYSIENVIGSNGNDVIHGQGGANRLEGGAGNDLLDGRGGDDRLDGGSGFDTASYAGSPGVVIADLNAGTATDGHGGHDTLIDIEALIGSAQNDTLYGDSASNRLEGGGGGDYLNGRAGNDVLEGGAGNDRLIGGIGADELRGGSGADTFDYNATNESFRADGPMLKVKLNLYDTIKDFNGSEGDRIDLHDIDARANQSGNQDFAFIGTQQFTAEGQVRVQQGDGGLWVEVNTTGAGSAEMHIFLEGVQNVNAGDFLL